MSFVFDTLMIVTILTASCWWRKKYVIENIFKCAFVGLQRDCKTFCNAQMRNIYNKLFGTNYAGIISTEASSHDKIGITADNSVGFKQIMILIVMKQLLIILWGPLPVCMLMVDSKIKISVS